jgi:prephenate dehydrogenase
MTIQVGIIGCGLMGRRHADGYRTARVSVAVCGDTQQATAQALADHLDAEPTCDAIYQSADCGQAIEVEMI